METFTGYFVITGKNGLPLNNVTVELLEIIEFTPASPDPQAHIVATGTTDEAGEVTFGSLDDTKRYFVRPRVPNAQVQIVLPTSVGGSGAPASATYVTKDAEAGLSAETRHRDLSGADLHVPQGHAHGSHSGITTDAHHPQIHTIASHSDTSATGSQLNKVTDGSEVDILHTHPGTFYIPIASISEDGFIISV